MSQLALDLNQRPAQGREDFLITPSNEMAVAWIDRWPDWPSPAVALSGPPGSGKTHLLRVWQAASGAVEIDPERLEDAAPPQLLGSASAAALDDLEPALAGRADRQEALLHLYNLVVERGGSLLLTAREAPRRWPIELPDLVSRLVTAQAVELGAPDDTLLEALLVKLFADRQLSVTPEVVRYLLRRMERSGAAALELVARLDRRSLEVGRAVTKPLARKVLDEELAGEEKADKEG